ncbi:MAG: hypothetical protein CME59_11620 [Halioglobus sp.]|nr:hypothetical protein [Halioglobus sp.]
MLKKMILAGGVGLALSLGVATAQEGRVESAVTCADLDWSAQVLAANPDIAQACRAVYEKDGKLYAQARVEVVRVRGNTMTFRTLLTDGSKGDSRSVTLDSDWRATIGGRRYRASDLMRGQELNVYLPEDRFALHIQDEERPDEIVVLVIEQATVMPSTASPLFLTGLAGGALLALGGVVGALRRRPG